MKNVEMIVKNDKLVITVDLTREFGPSKSGKTTIVASSEGIVNVNDSGIKLGLNVFK